MRTAAGGEASNQFDDRNDRHHSIVSELVSLIEHVQASMKLIEAAVAREKASGDQEAAANIFVLDDVTPRYVKANAALDACDAGLGIALHYLLDAQAASPGISRFVATDRRPIDQINRG